MRYGRRQSPSMDTSPPPQNPQLDTTRGQSEAIRTKLVRLLCPIVGDSAKVIFRQIQDYDSQQGLWSEALPNFLRGGTEFGNSCVRTNRKQPASYTRSVPTPSATPQHESPKSLTVMLPKSDEVTHKGILVSHLCGATFASMVGLRWESRLRLRTRLLESVWSCEGHELGTIATMATT